MVTSAQLHATDVLTARKAVRCPLHMRPATLKSLRLPGPIPLLPPRHNRALLSLRSLPVTSRAEHCPFRVNAVYRGYLCAQVRAVRCVLHRINCERYSCGNAVHVDSGISLDDMDMLEWRRVREVDGAET
jgi:hypothetical protein